MPEQSAKQSRWKRIAINCFVATSAMCLLIVGAPLFPKLIVDKTNWQVVGETFVWALQSNDAKKASSLILPEVQPWVDNWMAEHTPFTCPFSWNPGDWLIGTGAGSAVGAKSGAEASWSQGFECSVDDYYFGIAVNLKLVGQEWRIAEIERACERRGGPNRCWPFPLIK